MEASSNYYRNQLKPFLVESIISLRTKIHTTVLEEMQLLPLTVEPFPNSCYLWNRKIQGLIIWIWTHLEERVWQKTQKKITKSYPTKDNNTFLSFLFFNFIFLKRSYTIKLTKVYTNNGQTTYHGKRLKITMRIQEIKTRVFETKKMIKKLSPSIGHKCPVSE